ncbi:hypothetical protein JCM10908_003888 [Rhodotorula pacifica]|uniref:beta-N-acetylhexosaminidase n=1 Tax=Rhodotorula pacifica TaxID=1495444 RepID=UPI0031729E35
MRHMFHQLLLLALVKAAFALWPRPKLHNSGSSFLRLAPDFQIVSDSHQSLPDDLREAVDRTLSLMKSDGHEVLLPGRAEAERQLGTSAPTLHALRFNLKLGPFSSISSESNKPYDSIDEAYTLHIDSSGATLAANTSLGLLRGLQTFGQLVYSLPEEDGSATSYIRNAPHRIEDRPAFPHRAFMLDTSRNLYPLPDLLRTIDIMSSVKMNVLHWHVVDAQSWPLESATFPDLARYGAYSSTQTYTLHDVRQVVKYAGARGIAVLLELDVPGHTASIANAYPEYIACYDSRPWSVYAAEPPAGQIKLGHPDALLFTKRLLHEAATLTPSPLLSSGGDEVNERCYLEDEDTSAAMLRYNSTLDDLLSEFVNGVHDSIRERAKTPVVWEEMVLKHDLDLGDDVVVMVWISSANARAVADKGHRIIHAASDYLYLDCGAGAWLGKTPNGRSWCDPFKSWQKVYSFDPYRNLTSEQRDLVLGGEALLWSEQASPENLDELAWPRAAAAAEVFWTGGALSAGGRSVEEALPRLHDWRYRAVRRGVQAAPLQPYWCALRPGACDAE